MKQEDIISIAILAKEQNSKVYVKYLSEKGELEALGYINNSDNDLSLDYLGTIYVRCYHTSNITEIPQTSIESIKLN